MRTLGYLSLIATLGFSLNTWSESSRSLGLPGYSAVLESVEKQYPEVSREVLSGHTKEEIEAAKEQAATELSQEAIGINPQAVLNLYSTNAYLRGAAMRGAWTPEYNFNTMTAATHAAVELEAGLERLRERNETIAFMPKMSAQKLVQLKAATQALVEFIEANHSTMKDSLEISPAQANALVNLLGAQESQIDGTYTFLRSLQSYYFDRFMHPEHIGARLKLMERAFLSKSDKSPSSRPPSNGRPKADAYIVITSGELKPNDPSLVAYFKHELSVAAGYQLYLTEHFEELLSPLPKSTATIEYRYFKTEKSSEILKELRQENFKKKLEELELMIKDLNLGEQIHGEYLTIYPQGESSSTIVRKKLRRLHQEMLPQEKYQ